MVAIKTEGLTKTYIRKYLFSSKKTIALENLNLEIEDGKVFGLLGLNGSGKTTLLKLLVGLLFPTKGSAYIFGEMVPHLSLLSRIGYLPEFPCFLMYLTASELLHFYGKLYDFSTKERERRVEKTLDLVDLRENRNDRLADFSKGMLERIGMAQVLLHDPELLLLDEPTSGLDPLGVKKMRQTILRLKEEGKTILLSSHFVTEVERVCDQVGILHKGRLKRVIEIRGLKVSLEDLFAETVSEEVV
ncbi:ABC transporter ATP-binding protein [bacterium]|nr:ABC transporter ATP-binding protein [bacterium]